MMNIIEVGFRLIARVARYSHHVRQFFYEIVLSDRRCPRCGGSLTMVTEGRARCTPCSFVVDPTVAFQRCAVCGGKPVLRVRRYRCRGCGVGVPSRFLFDGLAFDARYFRQKMAEHRQAKRQRVRRVREMLAHCRSSTLAPQVLDLQSVPGLEDALNALTAGLDTFGSWEWTGRGFDLRRYQRHIEAHIGPIAASFEDIPPLSDTPERDRVWRFIAVVFMDHAGRVCVRQDGLDIMVMQRETYREG